MLLKPLHRQLVALLGSADLNLVLHIRSAVCFRNSWRIADVFHPRDARHLSLGCAASQNRADRGQQYYQFTHSQHPVFQRPLPATARQIIPQLPRSFLSV